MRSVLIVLFAKANMYICFEVYCGLAIKYLGAVIEEVLLAYISMGRDDVKGGGEVNGDSDENRVVMFVRKRVPWQACS